MNRLEEIQEMINNFIYEKQQMRQEITELETMRNKIAQHRNEIKFVNGKRDDAFAQNAKAEIVELGKQIAELGNQSQELQNKLNSRYIEVKKQVNIRIDNLISEGIREIRKIEEQKRDLEDRISSYEARKAKYEVQRQEFLTRFGRMPELSADAEKDMELQEQEYLHNKEIIAPLNERIENKEEELSELAKNKRAFKNSNWHFIIKDESKEENIIENVEIQKINPIAQTTNEEDAAEDDDAQNEIDALLTAVEEVISPLDSESITEEVQNVKPTEEEAITLPLMDNIEEKVKTDFVVSDTENNNIQEIEENLFEDVKIENIEPLEEVEVEYIEPLEEINLEDIQPIEEISLEDIQPIQEIKIEETEPIEEVKIEEISAPEDIVLEDIQPIEEIKIEETEIKNIEPEEIKVENIQTVETEQENENVQEIKEEKVVEANSFETENKEQTIELDTLENIQNMEEHEDNNKNSVEAEEEIITYEDSLEKTRELPTLDGKVTLMNITAKFEEKELVYKAQLSNGKELNIYPRKQKTGNLILKYKENIEEIKEILINYAVAEYRALDKKVIKKIDPIICETLITFAKQYNYDAQSLIYNYAMSFSKYEECEIDTLPNITYNVSYMEGTNLNKKEKEILAKICKNAKKNEKIDIVGCNTGFSKIRYILKRTFNTNNANALPEGKY